MSCFGLSLDQSGCLNTIPTTRARTTCWHALWRPVVPCATPFSNSYVQRWGQTMVTAFLTSPCSPPTPSLTQKSDNDVLLSLLSPAVPCAINSQFFTSESESSRQWPAVPDIKFTVPQTHGGQTVTTSSSLCHHLAVLQYPVWLGKLDNDLDFFFCIFESRFYSSLLMFSQLLYLLSLPVAAPEGRPGMSDVSPLSGISGLSFDSTLLSPRLFFCLVLLPFLSYRFLPAGPFF